MASSGMFRGRRVVDPVPVQRGSLTRKLRQKSSFTGLEAAWENVGAVRTALEAAEARIQEVNAGLRPGTEYEEDFNEPVMKEVFSENQRFGRVARYELRPESCRREMSPRYSSDCRSSRRSLDFPLDSSRDSSRSSRMSSVQNGEESRLINGQHSPPSRDFRSISPPYINDTEAISNISSEGKTCITGSQRLPRFKEPGSSSELTGKSKSGISAGLSGTIGSNFEDSLEMPSTNGKKFDGRPLSALGIKPVIHNNSEALARLKERIKKQRNQASTCITKPMEITPVPVSTPVPMVTTEKEPLTAKAMSKRKVAPAPLPAVYRGFSEVEPKVTAAPDIAHGETRGRDSRSYSRTSCQRPPKPYQTTNSAAKRGKGAAKVQRFTAPRRPADVILTSSWRSGQETVKRVLGPPKKSKSAASNHPQSALSQPQSTLSQDTFSSATCSKTSHLEWKKDADKRSVSGSDKESTPSSPVEVPSVNGDVPMGGDEKHEDEDELSQHTLEVESDADDDDKLGNVKKSRVLSEEARNILSDLDLYSDQSDHEDKQATVRDAKSLPPKQSPTGKKRKAPPSQPKQEQLYPQEKVRHYDAVKVKKYMEKQVAERKKKMRQEKEMKCKAMEDRKKRLEELYNKQKKTLAANLSNKGKHKMGETYLKGQSDTRPAIYGFHHQFYHDEMEHPFEDTGVNESDKENIDVAPFKGLPTQQMRTHDKPYIDDYLYPSVPSSQSDEDKSRASSDEEEKSEIDMIVNGEREEEQGTRSDIRTDTEENESVLGYPGFHKALPDLEKHLLLQAAMQPKKAAAGQVPSGSTHAATTEDGDCLPSPSRADRIAAIRNTATALKQRLEEETRRLGLSLQASAQGGALPLTRGVLMADRDVFRGNLPGVVNIHEQAELNEELESMNTAATKIQAAYRGHSTRQGLNWKLPSGRTLGATIQEAWRQTPVMEGRGVMEVSSRYSTVMNDTSQDGESSVSEVQSGYSLGPGSSLHSHGIKVGDYIPERTCGIQITGSHPLPTGSYNPTIHREPWARPTGDSMSVINIYTRNRHPKLQLHEEQDKDQGSETASLLSDIEVDRTDDTASLLGDAQDLNETTKDLDKTMVPESPIKDQDYYDDDDFTLESEELHQTSVKRSPSPDMSYSQSFASRPDYMDSSQRSSTHSFSGSDISTREPLQATTTLPSVSTHPARLPPSVHFPSRQGGDRMSPGTLDHQLMAELNRLEYMEESVRQITDIERTKSVTFAQQETVSLAQILKAKQLAHARDMESLRLKAKQEALEAAQQLDEARKAAATASADAHHTVAMVKAEAASAVVEASNRLVKVQTEAARTTVLSARQVEEARTSAARTLQEAANHKTADIRDVASAAASAAAQAAVVSTIEQYHQEQRSLRQQASSRQKTRDSYLKDSYTDYSERSPSYSRSRLTRTAEESRTGIKRSAAGEGYTSDEFESFKESERTRSIPTASDISLDRTESKLSPAKRVSSEAPGSAHSVTRERSGADTTSASIPEEVDLSVPEGSLLSDDESVREVVPAAKKTKTKDDLDYSLMLEESMLSSRTATDDELDYRMILPSEGHRRRSIGKTGRSGSVGSDAGTVSYSSDENHDGHLSDSLHDKAAPFSGEDSFSKFTCDMVGLMKEEEVRAKHQQALLRLREKALKEKTKAEMAWLDLQKKRHRDKGADDIMPSIRKRQRGVLMRLQAEQAEIKRLKAANRVASYERKLLLMQQEEIVHLRRSTQKIREKVKDEDKSRSEVPEDVSPEKTMDSTIHSRSGRSPAGETTKNNSLSKTTTVPEELSAIQSPSVTADTSFPTYDDHEATMSGRDRKRSFSEGESDEGSVGRVVMVSKGSPTSSDSFVMQKLKKLKNQSSERYLTQREQKLMRRRHEAETLLASQRKLIEWERRLDEEEDKVCNLLNEALGIKVTRRQKAKRQPRAGDDETRGRSPTRNITPPVSASSPSKVSETTTVRLPSENTASSSRQRTVSERSASESSVAQDLPSMAPDRSRESSIPEIEAKSFSHDSSIPEEYENDTFESVDSTTIPSHSTPVRQSSPVKKSSVSTVNRRPSKDDEIKSEEETSLAETSDHSDIESRVRLLKDQLEQRKREAKRLYHERKRQRRAMLRAQEATLRKELQAVEMVIQKTKAELEQPSENKSPEEIRPGVSQGSVLGPYIPLDRETRLVNNTTPEPVTFLDEGLDEVVYTPPSEPSSRSSRVSIRPTDRTPSVVDTNSSDAKESVSTDKSDSSKYLLKDYKFVVDIDRNREPSVVDLSSESSAKAISEVKDLDISDRSGSLSGPEQSSKHALPSSSGEIQEKVRTAEDVSINNSSEIRTVSQRDVVRSPSSERSPSERSIKTELSEHGSVLSEVATAPLSRGSAKKQKEVSKISKEYSYTFESDYDEDARTEDDISEHISSEDEKKSDIDVSKHLQKIGDFLNLRQRNLAVRDDDSSISEELLSDGSDTTITEDISKPNPTVSREDLFEKDELEVRLRSQCGESALSVYSDDFEPSVGDKESTGDKRELETRAGSSYTLDFEASESQRTKRSEVSLAEETSARGEASSFYTPDLELWATSKKEVEDSLGKAAQDRSVLKEGKPQESRAVSKVDVESTTDDDSVSEELPEIEEDVAYSRSRTSSDTSDDTTLSLLIEKGVPQGDTSLVPEKDREHSLKDKGTDKVQPSKERYEPQAITGDKITQQLTEMLLDEALSCVTNIYEAHRQDDTSEKSKLLVEEGGLTVDHLTPQAERKPQRGLDSIDNVTTHDKVGLKQSEREKPKELWPEQLGEISEADDVSISERLSFSDDDASIPGLDFKLKEELVPEMAQVEKKPVSRVPMQKSDVPKKVDKQTRSDAVVSQLSEDLLKEAVSQMIDLMRQKNEKQKASQEREQVKTPEKHDDGEASPCETSPRFLDKFMVVHRFPDGILKQHSPPGSPTKKEASGLDGHELADKLSQLKLLHDELGHHLDDGHDDDDDDFVVNANKELELPTDDEEVFGRPRRQSILFVVSHQFSEVTSIVASSLSRYYSRKQAGLSLGNVTPPPEIAESGDIEDPDTNAQRVYRRLIFDLTGDVFRDILNEEAPPARPSWMKQRRRRKTRFYHNLSPLMEESDYVSVVQQRVIDLIGLGSDRPSLESLRRKTPLKAGKKDVVDAILIQELREEEPQWVDYDDDELAVKFQVADAIFDSLLSETVMVMNAIQNRRDSRSDLER